MAEQSLIRGGLIREYEKIEQWKSTALYAQKNDKLKNRLVIFYEILCLDGIYGGY